MKEAGRKSLDAQARGRHGRLAAVPAPGGHDLHGWQQVLMRLRQFRITAVLRTGIARLLIAGREGQAVVETSVAQPLEAQIVGADQMLYMKSTSGNDGSYTLTVSFRPRGALFNAKRAELPALSRTVTVAAPQPPSRSSETVPGCAGLLDGVKKTFIAP